MDGVGGGAEDAVKWRLGALAAVLAVAAFLRFDRLYAPSYWLDEILYEQLTGTMASQPWWTWLTTSHAEHAGLYYLTQLLLPGRVAAAIFGLLTIALVWRIDARSGVVAAMLLAVSPLHVYYSREARSYALLMLLTAALIFILLRGRSLLLLCLTLLALLYTAALAVPVVLAAFAVSLVRARERWYRYAAIACLITLPLFRWLYTSKPYEGAGWPPFPPVDAAFFAELLRAFTAPELAAGAAMLALAVAGAVVVTRRNVRDGVVLLGMTLLPLVGALAALKLYDHFYASRYVTPALIGFVLLLAAGIQAVVRVEWAGALVAILVATQTWTAARTEPLRKLDWRAIAETIWKHSRPEDLIIAAEPWSEVSLRYYLMQLPPRAQLVHIFAPDVADMQRSGRPAVWLVTAGHTADPRVRNWMCQYPLLLASPLENFRLHYASPRVDGNRMLFYGDGWGWPEGTFRWAAAKQAKVVVPRWGRRDEAVSMRVLPFTHPSLPAQTMRVTLNGHELGRVTLPPEITEHTFAAPARFWIDGENVLAFDFGHAVAPAAVDPAFTDQRTLAVRFDALTVSRPLTRIAALIERRHAETRFPPERLNRDAVARLIARLGFDPRDVWPRLERGQLTLDDVLDTVAWGGECYDGRQFLDTAFAALLEREAAPHEVRDLAALPRERAVGRIAKWDEFRRRVLR